ncbi:unnamed protein product [Rotaria sp. Silwood2]|nr:unnamed protein product [Rotaria sp. Silwood2]
MGIVFTRHGSNFDIVISCDKSIPHLLTDKNIFFALKQMYSCLRPGDGCLIIIRDYDREQRGAATAVVSNTSVGNAATILKGVWVNELGSTLNITSVFKSTLQIKGNYRSPSGTAGDQYALNGFVNLSPMVTGKHNVIVVSFTVHWSNIGSVTTWNGFYSEGDYDDKDGAPGRIICQWLLVRPVTNYKWDHILTGQDRFTKKT